MFHAVGFDWYIGHENQPARLACSRIINTRKELKPPEAKAMIHGI
jgi:hypothetical protein